MFTENNFYLKKQKPQKYAISEASACRVWDIALPRVTDDGLMKEGKAISHTLKMY